MKKIYLFLLTTGFLTAFALHSKAQPDPSIYTSWENGFTTSLKNTLDMALPPFGPYSDRYNGISHIPAKNNGFRFDVIVQPSFYMRNITPLANVKRESGYHPWESTADLSFFSYRYQLEWKDRVYCDVSFNKVDDQTRLIRAEFVNNTENNRSLALNIFNTIVFPFEKRIRAILPQNAVWQKAADYQSFREQTYSWNYNLVYDGQLRGQVKDELAVSGNAIIAGANNTVIDYLRLINNGRLRKGTLLLRYKKLAEGNTTIQVNLNGQLANTVDLGSEREFALAKIPLNKIPDGEVTLSLKFLNGSAVRLDGFTLINEEDAAKVTFTEDKLNYISKRIKAGLPNAIILKYDDINEYYGLIWSDLSAEKRELFDSNADKAIAVFNNLVRSGNKPSETVRIKGNNEGWFFNIFSAPIIVKPHETATGYAYLVCGTDENEVTEKLNDLNTRWPQAESIYHRQRVRSKESNINPTGETYRFSQQLMKATALTNLIYPSFAQNQFIKHTTPGKRWSSLYTWDSGFIGLGFSALNLGRALESLNAYTMDSTRQSAFLEHGTPLPTQAYLFNEIWNKSQNLEYLKYFYPRLKRYYNYLSGAESSPTRKLKSNLIATWDIFYNSGGWDDYSPQVYVHQKKLESTVAPTINTAHQIRFAKFLKMAAWQLGQNEDIKKYDEEIVKYTKALQQLAWDETSGYYGYVQHNKSGNALGILRHLSGKNFNMGLDGCSPLLAGICNEDQTRKIVDHLFTKGQLWTVHGITAIDQSAPYYDKDGYWNGRVWMPHQWFFWKTMLDLNEPDKAIQIAKTALEVWKRETEDTYNCWENFSVETGNGGGWHQFGALSSPVLNWYEALYKAGTITNGFDVWPISEKFSAFNDEFNGKFKLFGSSSKLKSTLLICLDQKNAYEAFCNGEKVALKKIHEGLYSVALTSIANDDNIADLSIVKKK